MPRKLGQGSSLFERLDPELPPLRTRTRRELANERIRAIKQHLSWLLNSRRGCSQSSPGLGLQDFNDATLSSADLRFRICQDIRETVIAFEPRIKAVDVQPTGTGEHLLQFRIRCLLSLENNEEALEIDLSVSRQGRPTVAM
ncbi:TPA: type VI secretion system baseplate subunit TssE [Pseudomonas aeruginosa]|uniref:type VI secretion system baseplate subunit TssE n=1 Tax=Pseudomonas aeruginosa TaxID=287 RepID=UPI001F3FA128|nr:type VI secretion system baseplate subunit TssE [Pseudomonas aeruginosa]MDG3713985.1 type VI secretion system baseplate subunit TssE [Pseudomonas aeruginosa]HBO3623974.1 type VI secretion system baseplate subunit TssE [Pseudomonas aeruginosa]